LPGRPGLPESADGIQLSLQLRNAALKNGFADLRRIIATYDEKMSPHAQLIFEKRKWLTALLKPLLQQTYASLSEERETIDCIYESQLHELSFELLADKNWDGDKNTQRTNAGIIKMISFNDKK
jgi:DNA replication and repair protein RecF